MALPYLSDLDKHKATPFPPSYPNHLRDFYAPVDDLRGVLADLIASASHSLVLGMYGYDDPQLDAAIRQKCADGSVYVQMSLDATQAAGKVEREILAQWQHEAIGNSISIGHSERGAIQHLKLLICDGLDVVTGSTNWSVGAETKQDNHMVIVRDPVFAAAARTRLDLLHDSQLKAMAKKAA